MNLITDQDVYATLRTRIAELENRRPKPSRLEIELGFACAILHGPDWFDKRPEAVASSAKDYADALIKQSEAK